MRRTITIAALLAVLAGCGGGKPDVAACERAMRAELASGIANPDQPPGTRPPACKGVDDKTLQDLAVKILAGQ